MSFTVIGFSDQGGEIYGYLRERGFTKWNYPLKFLSSQKLLMKENLTRQELTVNNIFVVAILFNHNLSWEMSTAEANKIK